MRQIFIEKGVMQDTRILYIFAKYILLINAFLWASKMFMCQGWTSMGITFVGGMVSAIGFFVVRAMLHDNDGINDQISNFCIRLFGI